jgi:hypothetical protein
MLHVDERRLLGVIQCAFDRVVGDRRWQTAIAKAKQQFESNPYMHWDGESLLVLSDSNELYVAGRVCQCTAYRRGKPCWHRAAARLLRRYFETTRC